MRIMIFFTFYRKVLNRIGRKFSIFLLLLYKMPQNLRKKGPPLCFLAVRRPLWGWIFGSALCYMMLSSWVWVWPFSSVQLQLPDQE